MATITGLTADRMLDIEGASIVDAEIVSGNLILTKHDGTQINAGPVLGPPGPTGPMGPGGGQIPGEVKLWSGTNLPDLATYGKWVWADGGVYPIATYPLASANISSAWKTAHGQSDPGAGNFRVPDLRGLTPVGLDAMPGGSRANRMTRTIAITLAGKTGEEIHTLSVPEMPSHGHDASLSGSTDTVGNHAHSYYEPGAPSGLAYVPGGGSASFATGANIRDTQGAGSHSHGVSVNGSIGSSGGNGSHENVQPSVFVPYIVKLD